MYYNLLTLIAPSMGLTFHIHLDLECETHVVVNMVFRRLLWCVVTLLAFVMNLTEQTKIPGWWASMAFA